MAEPAAKRVRLSTEYVLLEPQNDDEPMMAGSDEFEDMLCTDIATENVRFKYACALY